MGKKEVTGWSQIDITKKIYVISYSIKNLQDIFHDLTSESTAKTNINVKVILISSE